MARKEELLDDDDLFDGDVYVEEEPPRDAADLVGTWTGATAGADGEDEAADDLVDDEPSHAAREPVEVAGAASRERDMPPAPAWRERPTGMEAEPGSWEPVRAVRVAKPAAAPRARAAAPARSAASSRGRLERRPRRSRAQVNRTAVLSALVVALVVALGAQTLRKREAAASAAAAPPAAALKPAAAGVRMTSTGHHDKRKATSGTPRRVASAKRRATSRRRTTRRRPLRRVRRRAVVRAAPVGGVRAAHAPAPRSRPVVARPAAPVVRARPVVPRSAPRLASAADASSSFGLGAG